MSEGSSSIASAIALEVDVVDNSVHLMAPIEVVEGMAQAAQVWPSDEAIESMIDLRIQLAQIEVYTLHNIPPPTRQGCKIHCGTPDKPITNQVHDAHTRPCQFPATLLDGQALLRSTLHITSFGGADHQAAASSPTSQEPHPLALRSPSVAAPWVAAAETGFPTFRPMRYGCRGDQRSLCGSRSWRGETALSNAS
jgi:hypothetical protein